MNVELKPRTTSFSLLAPAPANDNAERRSEVGQPRRRAIIYRPGKSAMTSGRAGTKRWVLEFEPQSALFIEPLMGWTGSTDPMAHLRLTFPDREAAIAYAQRHGLDYEIRERQERVAPKLTQPAELLPLATPEMEVFQVLAWPTNQEAAIGSRAVNAA